MGSEVQEFQLTVSRYLLDTHAALFWWSDETRLGERARALLADPEAEMFVSAATGWEIATKFRVGKLNDIGDPAVHYRALMERNGFIGLPIDDRHGLRAGLLPGDHRDPFDRMIAAQALIEKMPVITRDQAIAGFGCKVIW